MDETRPYEQPPTPGQQPPADQLWPCPRCSTPIPSSSVFCPRCGLQLAGAPAAAGRAGSSTARRIAVIIGGLVLVLFIVGLLAAAFGPRAPIALGPTASPTATPTAFAVPPPPTPTHPPTPAPTPEPVTPAPIPTAAPTPSPTAAPTPAPTAPSTPEPTPEPTPQPTPEPPEQDREGLFYDGIWEVGSEIAPGTYRTLSDPDSCYWARLSGFGGSVDDIIANSFGSGYQVVTIGRRDRGFEASDCGYWTSDLSQVTDSDTEFEDGTYIVGVDIEPGTYRSSEGDGCYWARLSGFGGTLREIIANDFRTGGRARVQIRARDTGFTSSGCGNWTRD